MSWTREIVSKLSTVRVSRETSFNSNDAYSITFSGLRNRPRANVSLTRRMLESGVFNSCVTADTNSDFIVANTAADRAARTVKSRAITAAAAATEIKRKVRRAPRAADMNDSSAIDCVRAVHDRKGRLSPVDAPRPRSQKTTRNV